MTSTDAIAADNAWTNKVRKKDRNIEQAAVGVEFWEHGSAYNSSIWVGVEALQRQQRLRTQRRTESTCVAADLSTVSEFFVYRSLSTDTCLLYTSDAADE